MAGRVRYGQFAGTTPVRMRCGWSPTGIRAISFFVPYEITDIRSVPLQET
jgi:hypothetical protein